MILLIQLFLAHLIGDFLLQPTSWVIAKEQQKLRAYQLYLHTFIHGLLILFITWDLSLWPLALLLSGMHLLIDGLKINLQKESTQRAYFFYDQLAHIISIVFLWAVYVDFEFAHFSIFKLQTLLLFTSLFLITIPTSIFIKLFISKWTPHTEDKKDNSLQNAGKYIGYIERVLVFIFIIFDHWEAVGFLITAKSVFRFGDLKASKDRKLTEYVLIGTLLSFGIALLIGIAYHYLSNFTF